MTACEYNTAHANENTALRTLGWWPFADDPCTRDGVDEITRWQAAHGLTPDGKLGAGCWAKLRSIYRPAWGNVARGHAEILARFGDPCRSATSRAVWAETNLVSATVCGKKIRNVHRHIVAELTELMTVATAISGYHPASVQTWNVRQKRGGDRKPSDSPSWSTHSWAIAFDVDPSLNPWGNKPTSPIIARPLFAAVFRVACWSLGCDWKTPDTMHFQACRGY